MTSEGFTTGNYKFPKEMFLNEEDLDKFDKATKCHICDITTRKR